MKFLILLVMMLTLVSCGGNARLDGIFLSGTSGVASSDATMGSEVGSVTITGSQCTLTSYSLEDDKNGYFKVSSEGKILLAKDNPPAGTYDLVVIGRCDGQISRAIVRIVISSVISAVEPCDSSQRIRNLSDANYMRGYHGSVKLSENELMFIGGNWRDTPGAQTPEIYNVQNDTFTPVAPNLMPRFSPTVVKMKDGKVMVIAGSASGSGVGADSLVEIYDKNTDVWTQAESLKFPRWRGAGLLLKSGKIAYLGGSGTTYLEIFDPQTGSWSTMASMQIARQGFKIIEKANGNIVAFGGYNQATYTSVRSVEEYDVATNTWSFITDMHSPRSEYELVKKGNKVFIIAGSNTSGVNVEVYDLDSNTSELINPIGSTYTLLSGVLSNGNIVATGGLSYPVYVLDIETLEWTNVVTIPGNYRASTMEVLEDDSIILMGGVASGGQIHEHAVRVCLSDI